MPEDFIDFEKFQKKLSPKMIVVGIVVLLIIIMGFSSFYMVDQKEEALWLTGDH